MCGDVYVGWLAAGLLLVAGVCSPALAQPSAGDLPRSEVFVVMRDPGPARRGDVIGRRRLAAAQQARAAARADPGAVRVRRSLHLTAAFTAGVSPAGLARLRTDPDVAAVEPVAAGHAALADTVPLIRADAVHAYDSLGSGVTVAVLDGGLDSTHPDLAGRIAAEACFCSNNCCPNGSDRQFGPGAAAAAGTADTHAAHVAGIIVSRGVAAPRGVAPDAHIVAVKVLDAELTGTLADWIAALEWIAANRPDVQAINMSLETAQLYTGVCDGADAATTAFARVIDLLRAQGVLVFAAAGNAYQAAALSAPACIAGAVAVGAATKADRVAAFSNSDTPLDLWAPGVGIASVGSGSGSTWMSGTSAATPHVTATAALLLGRNPSVVAGPIEAALETSPVQIADRRNGLVRPRIHALAAMGAVDRITVPVLGGGSRRSDCLVTWRLPPSTAAAPRPAAGTVCHDNDPACDSDPTPGQCGLAITACFNTADRRLPYCETAVPVVAARLAWPDALRSNDPIDAGNAAAVAAALPAAPIGAEQCGAPMTFVVPAGTGSRWLRLTAATAPADVGGSRQDHDRLRFRCLPAS